jgi:hypothetical protein
MWDKDDHFSRWVQGICAIPLIAWCIFGTYLELHDPYSNYSRYGTIGASVIGSGYVAYRCLWYAITGRRSINRDVS